jgi:hypothetical protein
VKQTLLLPLLFLFCLTFSAQAQTSGVGIGTTAPDASAALDVASSSKGALLPRLTAAARAGIVAPAAGLIVYQTDGAQPGFWYNAGTAAAPKWLRLTDSDGVSFDPATGLSVGASGSYSVLVDQPGQRSNFLQPFRGDNADNRVQFVVRATDLRAAGLQPGLITGLELNIISKASTQPYQNFTLRVGPTTRVEATTPFQFDGQGTVVYSGPLSTQTGWNTFTFSTPVQWDGSSNLLLHFCHDNAAPLGGVDVVEGYLASYTSYMRISDPAGPASGCTLAQGTAFNLNALPAIRWHLRPGYTLPATGGAPGQVLVQQPGGGVRFQTPAWDVAAGHIVPTDTSRRVGIGTTRPRARLDIVSGADYNGTNDPQALAFQWRGGGYRHWLRTRHNGSLFGGNALDFYLNNSAHADSSRTPTRGTQHVLTLDNNGGPRVGIGVTNPISMLANTTAGILGSDGVATFPGALTWATDQAGYAGLFFNKSAAGFSHGLLVKVASTAANSTAFEVAQGSTATGPATPLLNIRGDGMATVGGNFGRTRLSISPMSLEPKITLWDLGDPSHHYGFGVSDHQLNYHVLSTLDSHIFYAGGKNGNGVQLLRVQGNGFVGVGSSTQPQARLYVHSTGDADRGLQVSDGSQSNIIVQGLTGGNSGFQAINFNGFYNAGEHQINTAKNRWRFGVDQRGSTDALFIDTYNNGSGVSVLSAQPNGNIGLGMSPSYRLDVNGQVRASNISITSDQRLKANIRPLSSALTSVQALRGVRYTFRQEEFKDKNLPGGEQVGVLAQEVEKVYPELVSTDAQGFKSVNYAQLTPVLIEAVKELATQNELLRAQAERAQAQAIRIEQRLKALEAAAVPTRQ